MWWLYVDDVSSEIMIVLLVIQSSCLIALLVDGLIIQRKYAKKEIEKKKVDAK